MIERGNDAEAGRGKRRGAEERHRDRVLDRWRARQSRHGEGRGAEHDRRRHQPARDCRRAKQRLRHRGEHEEGDEQADAAIGDQRAGEHDREHRAPRRPDCSVIKLATADTEPLSSMSLPNRAPSRKIGKNCARNRAALPMKICVQLASSGSPPKAAATRAAAGASSSTLQPRKASQTKRPSPTECREGPSVNTPPAARPDRR